MAILDLYDGSLLREADARLIDPLRQCQKNGLFESVIKGPEVIDILLARDWLALCYASSVSRTSKGTLLLGEFGGVMPLYEGKRIIAISKPSQNKMMAGMEQVQEWTGTAEGLDQVLHELTEYPLKYRGDIPIVDGCRNFANYDFMTKAGMGSLFDALTTDVYSLFSASGMHVLGTGKQLRGGRAENYVFQLPHNEALFAELTKPGADKIAVLKARKELLVPQQVVLGFHITYGLNTVTVAPVICERDSHQDWASRGVHATRSELGAIGASEAFRPLIGLYGSDLLQ